MRTVLILAGLAVWGVVGLIKVAANSMDAWGMFVTTGRKPWDKK